MVTIKYLIDITAPAEQIGCVGDVKDVSRHVARQLISGGYAEEVKRIKKTTKSKDEKNDVK